MRLRLYELTRQHDQYRTLTALAKAMHYTQPVLSWWNTGKVKPSEENIQRLMALLGVTREQLIDV
jgi:transcriptional regulator with XRE-family HTH domain